MYRVRLHPRDGDDIVMRPFPTREEAEAFVVSMGADPALLDGILPFADGLVLIDTETLHEGAWVMLSRLCATGDRTGGGA